MYRTDVEVCMPFTHMSLVNVFKVNPKPVLNSLQVVGNMRLA
jgi:hypothetical protein